MLCAGLGRNVPKNSARTLTVALGRLPKVLALRRYLANGFVKRGALPVVHEITLLGVTNRSAAVVRCASNET